MKYIYTLAACNAAVPFFCKSSYSLQFISITSEYLSNVNNGRFACNYSLLFKRPNNVVICYLFRSLLMRWNVKNIKFFQAFCVSTGKWHAISQERNRTFSVVNADFLEIISQYQIKTLNLQQ
jgi:hypothetical protein